MKQVLLINDNLKMSKGKIARICFGLGYSLKSPGYFKLKFWELGGRVAIILKSNDIDKDIEILKHYDIKYITHIDAGHTQVPKGSVCGIAFWIKKKSELFNDYKLL